jgi:hypothetical protein
MAYPALPLRSQMSGVRRALAQCEILCLGCTALIRSPLALESQTSSEAGKRLLSTPLGFCCDYLLHSVWGGIATVVRIEGGVVSGVINLESSGVGAAIWPHVP